ncbi:MAG: AAA family ATPase [Sulfuricellaceae bacterium]|nr:AAA family ATPase [Sulfuricellaceae bacterium]
MTDNLIFADTLLESFALAGLPYPGEPEPGKLLRFSTNPKGGSDKAGWLRLFPDGNGAVFGCWREGVEFVWQRSNGREATPQERDSWRQQAEALRQSAEAEREADYQAGAEKARAMWKDANLLKPEFPYLAKKGIKPHIARLSDDGRLMVPVRGADGEIQSIQFIATDGSKRFMTGGKMAGGWCLLGTVTPDNPVLLAEGFATAATLHEATGHPVFCCFMAGNLGTVACMIKERYPNHARLVCGDDDRARPDNPGRTKATAAAELTGAMLALPKFQGAAGSDFNDMAQEAGAGAVRRLIDAALHGDSKSTWFDLADWHAQDRFTGEPPRREMLVSGVFPMGKPALVAAAGGVGKSFSLLQLAREVAAGSDDDLMRPVLFGGVLQATGAAVLVTSEDDAIEVHSRLASMGEIPSRLYVVSLPDAGGVRPLFQADRAGVVSATPAWVELTRQLIAMKNLKLIVLDPLQPLAACDLNDAGAAQAVCSRLAALASETGAAVIISHHFSKQRDIETPAQAREAVRGSGALVDGVRCAYALWPMPMAKARATCTTLGRDYAPDCIVMGAVVKSNGKATRDVITLLRNDFGLLVDMTADLRDRAPKVKDLLPELKAAIAGAAADGKQPRPPDRSRAQRPGARGEVFAGAGFPAGVRGGTAQSATRRRHSARHA